jgi:hypothetical protein
VLSGGSNAILPESIGAAITLALDAYDALAELGEEVEDEWQYVQDLGDAWRARLELVDAARGGEALSLPTAAAVARLCEEAALIADPHRAIDWLSTFPQVLLVSLGERP